MGTQASLHWAQQVTEPCAGFVKALLKHYCSDEPHMTVLVLLSQVKTA